MRNVKVSVVVPDLAFQFRIPNSALRIRFTV